MDDIELSSIKLSLFNPMANTAILTKERMCVLLELQEQRYIDSPCIHYQGLLAPILDPSDVG